MIMLGVGDQRGDDSGAAGLDGADPAQAVEGLRAACQAENERRFDAYGFEQYVNVRIQGYLKDVDAPAYIEQKRSQANHRKKAWKAKQLDTWTADD